MNNKDVCIVKLLNGDELVGILSSETEHTVNIENPLVVEEQYNPDDGTSNIILTSYIPFSKSHQILNFSKFHVIQILPVIDEVKRYYINSVTYNQSYVSDNIKSKLSAVNDYMEKKMEQKVPLEPEIPEYSNNVLSFIHKNTSKSIH